jgi:hypothetical protein
VLPRFRNAFRIVNWEELTSPRPEFELSQGCASPRPEFEPASPRPDFEPSEDCGPLPGTKCHKPCIINYIFKIQNPWGVPTVKQVSNRIVKWTKTKSSAQIAENHWLNKYNKKRRILDLIKLEAVSNPFNPTYTYVLHKRHTNTFILDISSIILCTHPGMYVTQPHLCIIYDDEI